MNKVPELLRYLTENQAEIWVEEGERLLCSASKELLTSEIRSFMKAHKKDIINYLRQEVSLESKNNKLDSSSVNELLSDDEKKKTFSAAYSCLTTNMYQPGIILQLFIKQVNENPNKIAIYFGSERLTYLELNNKANFLCGILKRKGLKKGDYLPILMGSCLEVVIAILTSLKLGTVYVPIDEAWPQKRCSEIIKKLNCYTVLVNQSVTENFESTVDYYQININELGNVEQHRDMCSEPDDEIYVMFTSGSTGVPKGAINLHKGITNRLIYMNKKYKFYTADVVLQTTKHVYDSSFWQFFWPLINGGSVVMLDDYQRSDFSKLVELIDKYQVTITDFVPTVLDHFVKHIQIHTDNKYKLSSLRQIFVGGEAINSDVINQVRNFMPETNFTNAYGPTETSIGVIFYDIPPGRIDCLPIGRPIDNVYCLVLDSDQQLCGYGEAGELYIGGLCVGKGYLGQPEITKRSFIKNPFPEIESEILYKTGDVVSYLPDGNIQFLGRIDNQVKINGMRIELSEIEIALDMCDMVSQSVVMPYADKSGNKKLIAYVKLIDKTKYEPEKMLSYLRPLLPNYMLPALFIQVDRFSVSATGKLDKSALPTPVDDDFVSGNSEKNARLTNNAVSVISQVWESVLHVKQIDADRNFFEIGGNSLLTVQVCYKLKECFDKEIKIIDLFRYPTINKLAEYLES